MLVTGGNAAGIQNFVAAIFLVLFSFQRTERLLPGRWRREHRRWLTLFILFSGTMSTLDSSRPLLPVLIRGWTCLCFASRGIQLVIDRAQIKRDRLAVNLTWFLVPFSFSALAHWTERADLLALAYAPVCLLFLGRGMLAQRAARRRVT